MLWSYATRQRTSSKPRSRPPAPENRLENFIIVGYTTMFEVYILWYIIVQQCICIWICIWSVLSMVIYMSLMTSTLHARPISRGSFEGSHMPTKRIGLLDSSDIRVPSSRYEGDMSLPLSSSLLQEHQLVNNKRIYSWSVGCSQRHHLLPPRLIQKQIWIILTSMYTWKNSLILGM